MDKIGWAWEDYKEDIKRIQKVLLDNGFEASLTECHDFGIIILLKDLQLG